MSQERFLIWDFDGTLGYREGGWAGILLEVLESRLPGNKTTANDLRPFLRSGFPWHRAELSTGKRLDPAVWWSQLTPIFETAFVKGAGLDVQEARRLAPMAREVCADPSGWRLFDDSRSALQDLTLRGWSHIILTNHIPEFRQIVDSLGLLPHFRLVFNSAETGYEKPHPEAFLIALALPANGLGRLDDRRQHGRRRSWGQGRRYSGDSRSKAFGGGQVQVRGPARIGQDSQVAGFRLGSARASWNSRFLRLNSAHEHQLAAEDSASRA